VADADVLYANVQRNVLMTMGTERLFDLRWTGEIEAEWVRNLTSNRPDLIPANVKRTAALMRRALPNSNVRNYSTHAGKLIKTDPKDRHVAAAAIECNPSQLITWNLKHFDKSELAAFNVFVSNPDEFLCEIYDADPELAFAATIKSYGYVKKRDGRPSWNDYLEMIETSCSPNSLRLFAQKLKSRDFGDLFSTSPPIPPSGESLTLGSRYAAPLRVHCRPCARPGAATASRPTQPFSRWSPRRTKECDKWQERAGRPRQGRADGGSPQFRKGGKDVAAQASRTGRAS
jgi:hypothetical protein